VVLVRGSGRVVTADVVPRTRPVVAAGPEVVIVGPRHTTTIESLDPYDEKGPRVVEDAALAPVGEARRHRIGIDRPTDAPDDTVDRRRRRRRHRFRGRPAVGVLPPADVPIRTPVLGEWSEREVAAHVGIAPRDDEIPLEAVQADAPRFAFVRRALRGARCELVPCHELAHAG